MKNINSEINDFKQFKNKVKENKSNTKLSSSIRSLNSSYGGHTWQVDYNWQAEVSYAHGWAYGYNPNYGQYDSDCANFVSQCIYAGAPVMNWGSTWCSSKFIDGMAWINVDRQWNFLINNTGSGPVAMDNTHYLDIGIGDPIQLWSTYYNCYHHSIIVSDEDDYGGIYYCAHTTARRDYPLDQAYAQGSYNASKQRTAHIFGYNY